MINWRFFISLIKSAKTHFYNQISSFTRELYTAPFIYVPSEKCNISNGKCFDKFMVERIKVVNKHIVGLSIINLSLKTDNPRDKRCFVWKKEVIDNG